MDVRQNATAELAGEAAAIVDGGSSTISLDGWNIGTFDDLDWMPWGDGGIARAKILGDADGYLVTVVEAEPGYVGTPHEHDHAEFFYLIDGEVRNQGRTMRSGDGYAARAGSFHDDFATDGGATFLVIFKL